MIPRPVRQLLIAGAVSTASWCLGRLIGATDPDRAPRGPQDGPQTTCWVPVLMTASS